MVFLKKLHCSVNLVSPFGISLYLDDDHSITLSLKIYDFFSFGRWWKLWLEQSRLVQHSNSMCFMHYGRLYIHMMVLRFVMMLTIRWLYDDYVDSTRSCYFSYVYTSMHSWLNVHDDRSSRWKWGLWLTPGRSDWCDVFTRLDTSCLHRRRYWCDAEVVLQLPPTHLKFSRVKICLSGGEMQRLCIISLLLFVRRLQLCQRP